MAISYPLTPPAALKLSRIQLSAASATSRNASPYTYQSQQYNWPGQGLAINVTCPPMVRTDAEQVVSFLLKAHRGTFYFQDYANPSPRGSVTGTLTVATATAGSSTLTYSGGTGTFAEGDWVQVGYTLYKVVQVNSATSIEVFPELRSSYTAGTSVVRTNAKGLFRLAESQTEWSIEEAMVYGVQFSIIDAVTA